MVKLITTLVCLQASTALATLFDTILPTATPTITKDPWTCTTEPLQRFFMPPKPTGDLLKAVVSYGNELKKDCKPTLTNAMGGPECEFPPHTEWCGLATAIPTSLAPAYSSYGSAASSWWQAHSSQAVDFAVYCPGRWFTAMTAVPYGAIWLNDTIAISSCHAGVHATPQVATLTATPINTQTSTNEPSVTKDATSNGQSRIPKVRTVSKWAAAVTNMAAAVNMVM